MKIFRTGSAALFGLVLGLAGAMVHRALFPVGLIIMLALALSVGTLCLALAGRGGLVACFLGWVAGAALFSNTGPTGDVLVPETATASWVWMLGSFALLVMVMTLPKKWFRNSVTPIGGQTAEVVQPLHTIESEETTEE